MELGYFSYRKGGEMKLITKGLVLNFCCIFVKLKGEGRSYLTEERDGNHVKRCTVSFNLTTFL